MTEGIEVEVKLSIQDPEPIRALIKSPEPGALAGFAGSGPFREIAVLDRYFDTADGALAASLARARLRESGGRIVLAFKRQGVEERGVTERVELEGVATADLDPRAWADSAARRALVDIVGARELIETARLRQQRLVRDVTRGPTMVELSLDRLEALDGPVVVATRWELEAELKAGERDGVVELANALRVLPGVRLAAQSKRLFAMLAVERARAAAPDMGVRDDAGRNGPPRASER